jgi:hypothetical protein
MQEATGRLLLSMTSISGSLAMSDTEATSLSMSLGKTLNHLSSSLQLRHQMRAIELPIRIGLPKPRGSSEFRKKGLPVLFSYKRAQVIADHLIHRGSFLVSPFTRLFEKFIVDCQREVHAHRIRVHASGVNLGRNALKA